VFVSNKGLLEKILPKMGLNRSTEKELVNFIVHSYADCYKKFLQNKATIPPNQLVEIAYDDFTDNPISVLEAVYSQLDIGDFEKVRTPILNEVIASKAYKKNKHPNLTLEERRRINSSWGFMFEHYNYDVIDN
jgi:hypothetical protein